MSAGGISWVICAVLVVVVVVGVVLWRRRSRRAAETLRAEIAAREADKLAHEADRAALTVEQERELARHRADAERDRATLRDEVALAERAAAETRDLLRRGMRWDEAAQHVIAGVCREVGLHGTLVTNVVFVPVDTSRERKFVAQVDHLLLLESGVLVIESKNWKGLVFDGVLPSRVHRSLAGLIDESALTPPFAIQVGNRTTTTPEGKAEVWWKVSTSAGAGSPRRQVRLQAQRLSAFTKQQCGFAPWFDTCVFYSHLDATVHSVAEDSTNGTATPVVANRLELRQLLHTLAAKPPTALTPTRLETLTTLFADRGAHVERFGRYAAH